MIKKEKIAGIVVAYNIEKKALAKSIDSYRDFVDTVYIIDNSNKDMRLEELANTKIKYISMNGNKGIAKALNEGIKLAIKDAFEFALTMDQDSQFKNNLIDEYSKNEAKDVIIYSPDYIIERKKRKKHKTDTTELYWTMTSGNLLNLKLYQQVGQFKEKFFIDVVDYEYCLRAKKKGFRIIQCNKAELIHNPGIQKVKKILGRNYKYGDMKPERMYYQIRNLSWTAKEYKSSKAMILIMVKLLKIILFFENRKLRG